MNLHSSTKAPLRSRLLYFRFIYRVCWSLILLFYRCCTFEVDWLVLSLFWSRVRENTVHLISDTAASLYLLRTRLFFNNGATKLRRIEFFIYIRRRSIMPHTNRSFFILQHFNNLQYQSLRTIYIPRIRIRCNFSSGSQQSGQKQRKKDGNRSGPQRMILFKLNTLQHLMNALIDTMRYLHKHPLTALSGRKRKSLKTSNSSRPKGKSYTRASI